MGLLKALFGNYSEKEIKRIKPMQEKVLALDEEYQISPMMSCGTRPMNLRSALIRAKRLTIFCPRLLPPAEKPQAACSV